MLLTFIGKPEVSFPHTCIYCLIFVDRARDALKQCLPDALKDQTFASALVTEDSVQKWLNMLLKNLNESNLGKQTTLFPPSTSTNVQRDAW
jgi:hypothetical protein